MRILVSGSTKTVYAMAPLLADGLGLLVTPKNRNSVVTLAAQNLPWAVDNGAFSNFDAAGFRRLAEKVRGLPGLLWVVVPDVVAQAQATLDRFDEWAPELAGLPLAIAGQDGLEDLDVPWDRFACFFIGGSTAWKLSHAAADLAGEAKRRGKLVHMGRVNSLQRMRFAQLIGCDTCDGSSASKWPRKYLRKYVDWLRRIRKQPMLG